MKIRQLVKFTFLNFCIVGNLKLLIYPVYHIPDNTLKLLVKTIFKIHLLIENDTIMEQLVFECMLQAMAEGHIHVREPNSLGQCWAKINRLRKLPHNE